MMPPEFPPARRTETSHATRFDNASRHAHWALRVALAGIFLYHGPTKFLMEPMMGMPAVLWYGTAILETVGAVLVLAGGFGPDWATRIGALLFIPVMLGAIMMVHAENGWSLMNNGMEFQVTVVLVSLYLALTGNRHVGSRSIDRTPT